MHILPPRDKIPGKREIAKKGTDYAQNYDLAVKAIADALKGETLEVIGVKTGKITEVSGFETVDIAVRTGRLDVMLKDENDAYIHVEEQRDMTKADLYRFAGYHFPAAKDRPDLTDVILASGNLSLKNRKIETPSGRYEPVIIDFSERDGKKRLEEIRKEVEEDRFDMLLELVFLPLYGKETGEERSEMVKEIIRFEIDLFHQRKMPEKLLGAAIVMSNKMLDRAFMKEIWEDIKMLDIVDFAREIGREEGHEKGLEKGKLGTAREMLADAFNEKFGFMPMRISDRIREIGHPDTLKSLFHQIFRCEDLEAFEEILGRVDS